MYSPREKVQEHAHSTNIYLKMTEVYFSKTWSILGYHDTLMYSPRYWAPNAPPALCFEFYQLHSFFYKNV